MGLFDTLKSNKEKPIYTCYRCKSECSGLFAGSKMKDGSFLCTNCLPQQTKLMKRKDVLNKGFNFWKLEKDRILADKYFSYREKEANRIQKFFASESYFGGELLVDREHMWFKAKQYDEVFPIQQIIHVAFIVNDADSLKMKVTAVITVDNWIYANIIVPFKFETDAFFKKSRLKDLGNYLLEFQSSVCKKATVSLM